MSCNRQIRASRKALWAQQRGRCRECGREMEYGPLDTNDGPLPDNYATVDHIIPKGRGGTSVRANLQLLCKACNEFKDSFTPAELNAFDAREEYRDRSTTQGNIG